MSTGMRLHYQEALAQLEARLREEGGLVCQALHAAREALTTGDVALADEVIAFDDAVDERYLKIEKDVELLLARQTPVAGDLRLVLAVLHINRNLERMGDQCVTMAKLTKLTDGLPSSDEILEVLDEMGLRAEQMTRMALDCLARRDGAAAEALDELDELIDQLNRVVMRRAVEFGDDQPEREWGVHMILAARALERIGDNAVDIAEQASYLVTGQFREFTDASRPDAT